MDHSVSFRLGKVPYRAIHMESTYVYFKNISLNSWQKSETSQEPIGVYQ